MIEIINAQNILKNYDIQEEILGFYPLQRSVIKGQIRYLYRIDLKNGQKLVCRISNESNYSPELIEQQIQFSEKMRSYGIPVSKKYRSSEKYCISYMYDNSEYHVTLEDYVGSDIETLNLQRFNDLGILLGRMHHISEMDPTKIAYWSVIGTEMRDSRAKYENLFSHFNSAIKELEIIQEVAKLHDDLLQILYDALLKLPHGAVHGDLSVFNNLVIRNGIISVIDFHEAGNEPFLYDMLSCFYSSVYKYSWRNQLKEINCQEAYEKFISGYCSQRKLSKMEEIYFPIAAALFDGLFYSKEILQEFYETGDQEVFQRLEVAKHCFNPSEHTII